MSTEAIEDYRRKAKAWLESKVAEFGSPARRGLDEAADLALGRRWQACKAANGYAGINWPKRYGGMGGTDLEKVIFDREESLLGFPNGYFTVSVGIPLPIMIRRGKEEDCLRLVPPAMRGENIWCQLFSEPGAGSDLAGLRLRAVRDGDHWILNGQKMWTTWAQHSDYGVIVTRSDPTVAKHKGLTYFWLDMHSPGITVRPFRLAPGYAHVNEVFFDDVRVPDSQRLGEVGEGFKVAMETLFIERYAASDESGFGPRAEALASLARETETENGLAIEDGRIRREIATAYRTQCALATIRDTTFLALAEGREPDAAGAVHKLVSVRLRQQLAATAMDLLGPSALAYDMGASARDNWAMSWMSAPIGRIAGGADEMLLNTIAEKIIGLPQDYRPDKGIPFDKIERG